MTGSVLTEEVFQVGLGETASKTFFTKDIGDCLRLTLLQVPDFLLDGAGRDQAVSGYIAGLADAVRTVDCLRLDGRVPPRIVKNDIACGGQVQPGAGCSET